MDIADLLAVCVNRGASDLHLSAGVAPMLRIDGDMQRGEWPVLDSDAVRGLIHSVMTEPQRVAFKAEREADFHTRWRAWAAFG